jgi:pyruvate-formate lyase-activating enzyme
VVVLFTRGWGRFVPKLHNYFAINFCKSPSYEINEQDIKPLTEFIAGIDSSLPVCFLAFRPNFALENHPGAGKSPEEKIKDGWALLIWE